LLSITEGVLDENLLCLLKSNHFFTCNLIIRLLQESNPDGNILTTNHCTTISSPNATVLDCTIAELKSGTYQ
jgi:hypothetical protein